MGAVTDQDGDVWQIESDGAGRVRLVSPTGVALVINSDGSISGRDVSSLVPEPHDGIFATYPTATTEIYEYRLGVTHICFVTVTYLAADKAQLSSAVRS